MKKSVWYLLIPFVFVYSIVTSSCESFAQNDAFPITWTPLELDFSEVETGATQIVTVKKEIGTTVTIISLDAYANGNEIPETAQWLRRVSEFSLPFFLVSGDSTKTSNYTFSVTFKRLFLPANIEQAEIVVQYRIGDGAIQFASIPVIFIKEETPA